jgi:hypothetical protein
MPSPTVSPFSDAAPVLSAATTRLSPEAAGVLLRVIGVLTHGPQALLSHKRIETTMKFYAELDPTLALQKWADHIEEADAATELSAFLDHLSDFTLYESLCTISTSDPNSFLVNLIHQMPGLSA